MQYRLGIDIGGTFTDFVAFDEANRELKASKNLHAGKIRSRA